MARTRRRFPYAAGLTFASAVVATLAAADWSQWRGPNRDGSGVVFTEPSTWPEQLTQGWKTSVGLGHSSPVLVGDRLYVHTRQQENEVVSAIDAATGQVIWQRRYPAPYRMHPSATTHGPGPKSTPVVADGRIYTLGISGILTAMDTMTGSIVWQHQAPAVAPEYGTSTSPVVDGSMLIAYVGGYDKGALTAFDTATGSERWKWTGDGPGYASPVIASFGGIKQIVTQSQDRVISVSAASGELLWAIPFKTPFTQNIVTPLVYRDTVIYSGLSAPTVAIRPMLRNGKWLTEAVWENETNGSMYMSSPVLVGDTIYGMSNLERGHLFALDARTGKTLWATQGRQGENMALVTSDKLLFALKNDAELIVARPNLESFQEVRRYTVADRGTWAHPVIDRNRIFIKDEDSLTLWTVPERAGSR